MVRSSGTSSPLARISLTLSPSSVPLLMCSRNRFPVESWTSRKFLCSFSACVPLPDPGGPKKIRYGASHVRLLTGRFRVAIILDVSPSPDASKRACVYACTGPRTDKGRHGSRLAVIATPGPAACPAALAAVLREGQDPTQQPPAPLRRLLRL